MAHSKVHALTQGASMLARFSLTLYTAFLQKSLFRFFITVILSVLGRVFNLLAFIISIQAIYIAFQSSASDGATFKGKQYFDMLGLSDVWVPWLLALLVVGVFMMPALLKFFETRIIAKVTKECHRLCLEQEVHLKTDLFVTTRVPGLLVNLSKFFSGALFIIISLFIIALFRIDMFILVLVVSIAVAVIVVFSSWRQITRASEVSPKQTAYITAARRAYNSKVTAEIEEITISASTAREAHFNTILRNWANVNRTAFYQVGLTGFATAAIVLFVFRLDDLDQSKLFMLLYLVIAIRYAITTARETGMMASKILELRTESATLSEIIDARFKAERRANT